MGLLLSYLIFGLSIVSLILGFYYLRCNKNSELSKYYLIASIGSAIWGLGFGFLIIQTNEIYAWYCRVFGMIGVFIYAIFGIKVFTTIANTPDKLKKIIVNISYLGIFLYPFVVLPERQIFQLADFGMSYVFANDIWNTLYYSYSVIVLVLFICILIKMRKDSKLKRQRYLNNKLWLFFICFCGGTVLDTLLPMLGVGAFPGSTLSQFVAIFIVYNALIYEKNNSLSLENVSNHLYYSINMPILVFNSDKKVNFVSEAAYSYFQITKGEEEKVTIKDLFVLATNDDGNDVFNSANKEYFVKKNDSYCSVVVEEVKDTYGDVVGYIMLVTDMTEKNKFIEELEKAKEVAEEASIIKDNFLANMSHEIITPLNAIVGVNQLIYNEKSIDKVKELSKEIDSSSKTLLNIVNDIFDFSKIQKGNLDLIIKEYSINNLINSVVDLYRDKIEEKSLEFNVSIDKFIPDKLMGDEKRIKQCVVNLLKNAIKYTDEGSISINVFGERISKEEINIFIEINDTGIGIKNEDIDCIFNSFNGLEKTINRTYEGTGLGLTIVKNLINLMDGNLQIQSEYGIGSTFVLNFPQNVVQVGDDSTFVLIEGEQSKIENKLSSERVIPKARLLVVDDNKINLMVLKEFLSVYGATIDQCKSGIEAVTMCKDNAYDMIFIDYMMPGMDGIETLKSIKSQDGKTNNNTPMIVVTANAIEGAKEFYLENGFDDYISKPIDTDYLDKIVFKYIDSDLIEVKKAQ